MTTTSDRVVFAEPLLDDEDVVHGAWLRIAKMNVTAEQRPPAWAFTWNLTEGVATRSPGLGDAAGFARWSIAEALQVVDLGADAVEALAQIVSAPPGTFHHSTVTQHRAAGPAHRVDVVTRIDVSAGRRVLRGLSHDLGPVEPRPDTISTASTVADLVALGTIRQHEWRAVVDLATLELICWFGPAPEEIAWQYDADTRADRIHLVDVPKAEAMAIELTSTPAGHVVRESIRFLGGDGAHVSFDLVAQKIALKGDAQAALVTLTKTPTNHF